LNATNFSTMREALADELFFTGPTGEFLTDAQYRAVFDRVAAKIGLQGLTPHHLRHTCASLAVQAGANVKAVQRLLGHASAVMTLDTYADLFDDDLVAVADALGGAMGDHCGTTAESGDDPEPENGL
jgi:integrase